MSKLYCVKLLKDDVIDSVQHLRAESNKEVHDIMDKNMELFDRYGLGYSGYSFFEVKE